MINETITLSRDTEATLVPAGDIIILEKGSSFMITQALGGTVTLRSDYGLFRIDSHNLDALGLGTIPDAEPEPAHDPEQPFSEEALWSALKTVFDPEIPINIVDLGLIYDLSCTQNDDESYTISAKMTLTAQGCGMGPTIANDAKLKLEALPFVHAATVDIVWDPAWTPHMISPEGRKTLGL